MAIARMWTAASIVPNRALTTPVARYNWNVSAGIRNMSSRNGTATLTLPNRASTPVAASVG